MTKRAASLLLLGALLLCAGVGLWSVPAALVTAGLLAIGAGIASLDDEARSRRSDGDRS